MAVKLKKHGSPIHLTDSANGKFVDFSLYGKAEQKQYSGKNLLEHSLQSVTNNGVTATIGADRSIKTSGTTTASFMLIVNFALPVGKYILSGCPIGGSSTGYNQRLDKSDGTNIGYDFGNGLTFELTEETNLVLYTCRSYTVGTSFNNLTFYPMIRLASITDSTYEPFTNGASPNPDYPQEITVAGASGSVEVVSCGKNLWNPLSKATNENGVERTGIVVPSGTYTITNNSGGEVFYRDGINANATLGKVSIQSTVTVRFNLEGVLWIPDGTSNMSAIQVENGIATGYEPYTETTSTIPTPDGLCGIKVSSGGNYVDENGQQWICDEVVKYADGSGKRVQRIGKDVFNGSDDELWGVQTTRVSGKYRNATQYLRGIIKAPETASRIFKGVCNIALTKSADGSGTYGANAGVSCATDGSVHIYSDSYNTSDVSLWTAYLSENPMILYYELATPIITDLSAEEIAEIEKLHTFYPVTNISNDADCGMAVTYISTMLEFIEPKTDWSPTSRFDIKDYNRIRNNLEYLYGTASIRVGTFDSDYMGNELVENSDEDKNWNVNFFNAFENNIHAISERVIRKDIGVKKTFYENGAFPNYEELNRIENAMLLNKKTLDSISEGLRRIPFRLGQFKTRL